MENLEFMINSFSFICKINFHLSFTINKFYSSTFILSDLIKAFCHIFITWHDVHARQSYNSLGSCSMNTVMSTDFDLFYCCI